MNAHLMDNAFSTIHFDKEKFINTPVLNNESKSTKTNRQMTASLNVILPGVLNTIVYLNLSHKCKATEMIITLLFILLIC